MCSNPHLFLNIVVDWKMLQQYGLITLFFIIDHRDLF